MFKEKKQRLYMKQFEVKYVKIGEKYNRTEKKNFLRGLFFLYSEYNDGKTFK